MLGEAQGSQSAQSEAKGWHPLATTGKTLFTQRSCVSRRFQSGDAVTVHLRGCDVRAEVLAVTRGIVSVRILSAQRRRLVGTTWAVRVGALRRLVESGELFGAESGGEDQPLPCPHISRREVGLLEFGGQDRGEDRGEEGGGHVSSILE